MGLAVGVFDFVFRIVLGPRLMLSNYAWLSATVLGSAFALVGGLQARLGSWRKRAERRSAATTEDEWRVASKVEVDPRFVVVPLVIAGVLFWGFVAYLIISGTLIIS
jgi:hypothetical protein